MLVDSDGCRDVNGIKNFIENNKNNFLLSATYKSGDVIKECLKYMDNPFFIIDEFHNLSKNNVKNYIENDEYNFDSYDEEVELLENNDNFYQLLKSENKFLFMSATPRVYELEDENECFNEDIFGKIVYNMSFSYAIENKLICDYTIWIPSIHEDNTELKEEIKNEVNISEIDNLL